MPENEKVKVVTVLEISRFTLLPPESTEEFVIPKKLARGVRQYLTASPKIETTNPKIPPWPKRLRRTRKGRGIRSRRFTIGSAIT